MSKDKTSTMAAFRIDIDKWESFKSYASENKTNPSALIKGFIDACLGISEDPPIPSPIPQNEDYQELSDRLDMMTSNLNSRLEFLEVQYQLSVNSEQPDTPKDSDDDPMETLYALRKGIGTENPIPINKLTIEDTKIYLEDVIASNKNQLNRKTKKETILELSRYPHPKGKKWDNNGLNQALAYFNLHWY